jgi:hypothetical protein
MLAENKSRRKIPKPTEDSGLLSCGLCGLEGTLDHSFVLLTTSDNTGLLSKIEGSYTLPG